MGYHKETLVASRSDLEVGARQLSLDFALRVSCASSVQLVLGAMALSRSCRAALAPVLRPRHFHTCSVLAARQEAAASVTPSRAKRIVPNLEPLPIDDDAMMDQVPVEDDAPEPMHKYLQQQRDMLYYLRLIEHEMPKLVGAYSFDRVSCAA